MFFVSFQKQEKMKCAVSDLNSPISCPWVPVISFYYFNVSNVRMYLLLCIMALGRWLLNVTSVKRLSRYWTKLSSWFPLSSPWVSSSACSGKWLEPICWFSCKTILQAALHSYNTLSRRNKIDLDSTQALFLLVAEKSMSCMSSSMREVYSRYRDTDGFLYITYASQEMFGAPPPAAARSPCWSWNRSSKGTF